MTKREMQQTVREIPHIYDLKIEDAQALLKEIRAGKTFEALCKAFDMGVVAGRQWEQALTRKRQEEVFTLKQAAERLGVTHRTALTYVETGALKATKSSNRWRIAAKDLEAFEDARLKG